MDKIQVVLGAVAVFLAVTIGLQMGLDKWCENFTQDQIIDEGIKICQTLI